MYDQDSFFTLTVVGQIGLIALSLALFVALIWLTKVTASLSRSRPLPLTFAVCLFYLFVWLSPQIYYAYYFVLLDDLPMQLVIQYPPSLRHIYETLTFTHSQNLSAHSQGLLGWAMIITSQLALNSKKCRNAAN